MRTKNFSASVDPGAQWKMGLLTATMATSTAGMALLVLLGQLPPGPRISLLAVTLLMAFFTLLLGVGAMMSVNRLRYQLSPQGLQIWIGPWRGPFIEMGKITGISRPEDTRLHLWTSMVGMRMPGLYVATVNNPTYGPVSLYTTTRDQHLVVLDTVDGRYGLSPANPEELIKALNQRGVPLVEPGAGGKFPARAVGARAPGLGRVEQALFAAALVITVAAGIGVWFRMGALPDQVPVHFDITGQPDRYGSPMELMGIAYLVLGTSLVTGVGMIWLFARQADAFTARLLALLSVATSTALSVVAIGMTWV